MVEKELNTKRHDFYANKLKNYVWADIDERSVNQQFFSFQDVAVCHFTCSGIRDIFHLNLC